MRFGFPWWIGAGDPLEGVELADTLGYDFLELSLDAPWPQGLSAPDVRDAVESRDVGLGVHAPWRDQALAHPRGVLAQAARTIAKQCIDWAIGAGASYAVFHVDARSFGRYPREQVVLDGLEHARQSLGALRAHAGDDLEVIVENTSSPLGTPGELSRFLEDVPDVGFCFDPGHAALVDEAGIDGAQREPEAWFQALGDRLTLVHLMDVAETPRGLVDHLVPGAGGLDLAGLLEATEQAGCDRVLVEAFYRDLERDEARTRDLGEARKLLESL